MSAKAIQYGGFWRRFAALWVDCLVLLPLAALIFWGNERYRLFSLYYIVPGNCITLFYSIYLVRRFGGTPGKRILGLRIRKVTGAPIGYREAILRHLPDFFLGLLTSIAMAIPLLQMTDVEYHALSWVERSKRLIDLAPPWFTPIRVLEHIWVWSEFVVLLTNRKRRALLDFLAGTVVVRDDFIGPESSEPSDTSPA